MNPQKYFYKAGLDVGSTTAKLAVVDKNQVLIYSDYRRHNTRILETVINIFSEINADLISGTIALGVTGSAGIGIFEKLNIPFVQEVISSTEVVRKNFPNVKTLIDIGGEDSKMIFFEKEKHPDIRMNGNCAGGTGAFIDQMADLLNIKVQELNELSRNYSHIYPIASRCGVFAKTDVQNLISRKIPVSDIAASIFQAVVIQILNTLARGETVKTDIMYIGGPLTFLPELVKAFNRNLHVTEKNIVIPDKPEIFPAYGVAIHNDINHLEIQIPGFIEKIRRIAAKPIKLSNRLEPLFSSGKEYLEWSENRFSKKVEKKSLKDYSRENCFVGIDSGSTTTKITIIGQNKELLFTYYTNNKGNPVNTVKNGLLRFREELRKIGREKSVEIKQTAVTGYGEDLIKAAFGIDTGIVETIAHYTAARFFCPEVSFILDIGGQDMKAIFVTNGLINRIELNESCSSGCGSFIQSFGNSLGYEVSEFSDIACRAKMPTDLGTRCTVFMNSKVKQSLRENASIEDISAGLAYSVIKNALYKVLKIRNINNLGEHIVVQGGTFRNQAIQRSFECITGKKVICTNIPEQMGAFGAAVIALENYTLLTNENPEAVVKTSFIGLEKIIDTDKFTTKQQHCKGCVNNCTITRFVFSSNKVFYTGNKCEKIFSNNGEKTQKGENLFEYKNKLLFDRKTFSQQADLDKSLPVIGIPRVLNIYENYPFWNTLLVNCGFTIELSSPSSTTIYECGRGTVMSDSICYPAKLVNGHIIELSRKNIDRILYPIVIYEKNEFADSDNSFNCPIVSSYPDVIKSAINTQTKNNILLDTPTINFNDTKLLRKACLEYVKRFDIKTTVFNKAFKLALAAQEAFKSDILVKGKKIIENALTKNRPLIVLAGRPYHADPLINHKTPEILADMGVDVITEDAISPCGNGNLKDLLIITQWSYPNRIYNAAKWVAIQPDNIQFVQINSFGCGPDAISIDECIDILKTGKKAHTLIRVDDIASTGSVKLRLRSLIESLKIKKPDRNVSTRQRITTADFEKTDKRRIILAPHFAEMYSPLIPALFAAAGYNFVVLPPPDKKSVEFGLKYSNNEICYPATIIVGDILKALKSGKYNRDDVAAGITQTGGQCRASTYLSLIKKGMVDAGYADVPVISVGTAGKTINPQPGFQIDWLKMLPVTFASVLFTDSIATMYYSMVVREEKKGESKKLLDRYHALADQPIRAKNVKKVFALLTTAVHDFNNIKVNNKCYPKIGIVGEIYVKYNSFGHRGIIDWLIEQGVEVVIPPILDFFIQEFVNIHVNKKANIIKGSFTTDMLILFLEQLSGKFIKRTQRILEKFLYFKPFHKIKDLSKMASEVLSLTNQFGEGWLIPAEIAAFAKQGINHVISVQPFGCIANHIISKGVEKRIKDLYPGLNILFLDFDDGTSEVNVLNRLHFMLKHVKENVSCK